MVAVTSRKTASYRWSSIIICFLLTARGLVSGVYHAAKAGRLLPRLTVMIPFHAIVHWAILGSVNSHVGSSFPLAINNSSRQISLHFMIINLWLNAVGYAFLVLMYRHSVQTIFNRNIPRLSSVIDDDGCIPLAPHPALESFNTHLLLLRPLEILFRFVTAPLRVLPDVIVLGETRCGTTNLCGHIVNLSSNLCQSPDDRVKIKCYTPFCAWNVPDLDHKESFYFVGHYLGIVDPYFYRMAFPLKITRWWEEQVRGNIFFCFDGCAQYLSSPTAPYLIASAYRNASPPVLVACVRNPVDQAVSWWQYENNAMTWGEGMGLKEWNTTLRSENYPPKNIAEAIEFSKSDFVQNAYANAESLGRIYLQQYCGGGDSSHSFKRLFGLLKGETKCLPSWAITWPAGQLSIIGRSGKYMDNIRRYNNVFSDAFASQISANSDKHSTSDNKVGFVHIVPIENQSDERVLKMAILPLLSDVILNVANRRKLAYTTVIPGMEKVIDRMCTNLKFDMTHRRNSSASLSHSEFGPTSEAISLLGNHFEAESDWYSSNAMQRERKREDCRA